ncbi:helix-turn-helix domain-containing protein [Krasilnikovia sp. MM14-A1259]|uniref:helix-turn-helix domain-containing protein n=1 Tax=Krasilnikovia sp. MM14-A1259 TaxID=3373539 RepID=UPI00380D80D9
MTTDPSSSVAQARTELGNRLRQLRRAAGLTGKALAAATGQHFTRISRIEHGIQAPTEANIRDWCTACGAADEITELIATARSVESAYLEWARQARAGMRRLGDLHSIATYRRTTTFRIHEPTILPGIFQTESYLRRMLSFWYAFLDAPDDTEATIAMRAERTASALMPAKRIAVILGEQALRTRRGSPLEHADQLTHLQTLMRLPFVSVGVIPADAQRRAIASVGFWIFDDNAVALETPTAAIKVTRPQEIARYARLFDELRREARYGREAHDVISRIRDRPQR